MSDVAQGKKLPRFIGRKIEYVLTGEQYDAFAEGSKHGYAQGWVDAKADALEQELRDLSAMAHDITGERDE